MTPQMSQEYQEYKEIWASAVGRIKWEPMNLCLVSGTCWDKALDKM